MKRQYRAACALLLVCLLLVSCAPPFPLEAGVALRVVFLDVGQGDAILIQTPEGNILIDAGPDDSEEALLRKLRDYGVERLRLAVFTHPDDDHIGGADGVLDAFPTEEIWLSVSEGEGESLAVLLAAAERQEAFVRRVKLWDGMELGDVSLQVLSPPDHGTYDTNEGSIVIRLTHGSASALFVGDADTAVEQVLLRDLGAGYLSCSLYKVGHHGSSTSTSPEFLNAMRPTWAVISCSAENAYGHPHGEVLDRLEAAGATVLRTDREGDIAFVSDGEGFLRVKR